MTIVTAFILQRDGSCPRGIETYLSQFKVLADTGLPIILFLDRSLHGRVNYPNVKVMYTSIQETWFWNQLGYGTYKIPEPKGHKDTIDYCIIQNSKPELCVRALDYTDDNHIVWVDFGIAGILRNAEHSLSKLKLFRPLQNIVIPGCWEHQTNNALPISWRFAGTIMSGDRHQITEFWSDCKKSLLEMLPYVTWEVNVWAHVESVQKHPITWYKSGHDDSLLNTDVFQKKGWIDQVTLTTAFFPRDEIFNKKGINEYYSWAKDLLSVDVPFHIFIDERVYERFWHLRESHQEKTFWVPTNIHDLYTFKSIDKIFNFQNKRNYRPDDKWSPQQMAVTNSKFQFTKESATKNVFNSANISWIDFGIIKTGVSVEKIRATVSKTVNKFKIGMLGIHDKEFSKNYPEFFKFGRPLMIGGYWGGPPNEVQKISELAIAKYDELLDLGYGHMDEQTIYQVWADHPAMFDFYAGDYHTIFDNYHQLVNPSNVQRCITTSIKSGREDIATQFIKQMPSENIEFPNDNVTVNVPKWLRYSSDFKGRYFKEAYFRKIIRHLMESDVIKKNKSIIDLGAWIGDNAIPWAKLISGTVYAIDPSQGNCEFINEMMLANDVKNVKILQKVMSDKVELLSWEGDIHHTSFKKSNGGHGIHSSTLDSLQEEGLFKDIGFIHLDVEGMEWSVINGAHNVIKSHRPIIAFEQHIEKEDYKGLSRHIANYEYRVFLNNEILPGCHTDCRNLIAIPTEICPPNIMNELNVLMNYPNLITEVI